MCSSYGPNTILKCCASLYITFLVKRFCIDIYADHSMIIDNLMKSIIIFMINSLTMPHDYQEKLEMMNLWHHLRIPCPSSEKMIYDYATNEKMTRTQLANEQFTKEQITNKEMTNKQMKNHQMTNEEMTKEQITHEQMTNAQKTNKQMTNEQMTNEQMTNEQKTNEQIANAQKQTNK